jgi:hypothetical protein
MCETYDIHRPSLSRHQVQLNVSEYNNTLEMNHSRNVVSCTASQQYTNILWKLKAHCLVDWSPQVVFVLNWINPAQIPTSNYSNIDFNIIRLPTTYCLFLSGSRTETIYFSSSTACYGNCERHPPLLYHSNYTWRRSGDTNLFIMQFLTSLYADLHF